MDTFTAFIMSGLGEGTLALPLAVSAPPPPPFEDPYVREYHLRDNRCYRTTPVDEAFVDHYMPVLRRVFLLIEQKTALFDELGPKFLKSKDLYAQQRWVRALTLARLHEEAVEALHRWSDFRIRMCEESEQRPFQTKIDVHVKCTFLWRRIGEYLRQYQGKAHEEIDFKIEVMNARIDGMMIKHKKKANPDITVALAKVLKKGENRQRMQALAQVYTNARHRLLGWDLEKRQQHDANLVDGRTYRGRVRKYRHMCKQFEMLFMMTKFDWQSASNDNFDWKSTSNE